MKLKPLSEQVVAITGASSGIGLATARLAAERGAMVMLISRDAEVLAHLVDDIQQRGGTAAFVAADVADREQLRAAAQETIRLFGRLDTWVNNAGVAIYANLLDTPPDEHERMLRTNYFGCVNGSQVAMDHLAAKGGALITVASVAADMPSPVMGAYSASKHAVAAFVRSLRIEVQAERIPVSVTLIKPSGIATPIARHAANHREGVPKIPPPAYDPILVARAILVAAEKPTREITIGGIGRLEVLFANLFPALFERIAPVIGPLLQDRTRAAAPSNNLFRAAGDGAERSPDERGRRFSLYDFAGRHRLVTVAMIAGVGLGLGVLKGASPLLRRKAGPGP